MAKSAFHDQSTLWPTLKRLARAARRRRLIAAPYIGEGAAGLLPLRRGDALVCALTIRNCKSGSVWPSELRKLWRKGVLVYSQSDLHAKVYLFGRAAVVGSANLSRNSRDALDEAGVVVRDRATVASIRQWFNARLGDPVQPGWLAKCERAFRRPRRLEAVGGTVRSQRRIDEGPRIWLVPVEPDSDRPEEERIAESGERQAKKQLLHPRLNEISRIRWHGRPDFAPGDVLVQLWREDGVVRVRLHGKLLRLKWGKTLRGTEFTYLFVEVPKRFRTLTTREFRRACLKVGYRFRGWHKVELRDRVTEQLILRTTSPDRLRR